MHTVKSNSACGHGLQTGSLRFRFCIEFYWSFCSDSAALTNRCAAVLLVAVFLQISNETSPVTYQHTLLLQDNWPFMQKSKNKQCLISVGFLACCLLNHQV